MDNLNLNFDFGQFALPLKPSTQQHLNKVYTELATMFLLSAAGAYLDIQLNLQGFITLAVTIISIVWFQFTNELMEPKKAKLLLYTFAITKGISLGALLDAVIDINEQVLFTALGSTGVIFTCFTLSVLYSRNRSTIFTASILSSLVSVLFWVRISNWFIGSSGLFDLELYLGLGLFCMYVIYDTQAMIIKSERGEKFVMRHAFELYTDFVGMFVRILIILLKKDEKKQKKRREQL